MILLNLFIEFFKIGAFSFGGGIATLPHIYSLSEKTGWYTATEVTNMITISQMTPGPLACNLATYVGFKLDGFLAGLVATIAFTIPAIIFIGIVCKVLEKFKSSKTIKTILKVLRAAALAIILVSSFVIFKIAFFDNQENLNISNFIFHINYKCIILAVFLIFCIKKFKISTLQSMILSGIIGLIIKF